MIMATTNNNNLLMLTLKYYNKMRANMSLKAYIGNP